jgi:hypothetical protein
MKVFCFFFSKMKRFLTFPDFALDAAGKSWMPAFAGMTGVAGFRAAP